MFEKQIPICECACLILPSFRVSDFYIFCEFFVCNSYVKMMYGILKVSKISWKYGVRKANSDLYLVSVFDPEPSLRLSDI